MPAKLLASDENRVAYIFFISRNMTTLQVSTTYIIHIVYIDIAFRNKMEESNQLS